VFSAGFMPMVAITPKQSKTGEKTPKTSAFTTKKIKVEQSRNRIEVATAEGNIVALPRMNRTLEDHLSLFPSRDDLIADVSISKTMEALQKHMMELKEMQELSSLLGITIKDASLLPLYREAADWLGTRYRRGGMSRKAVDCSGFTNIIYKNVFGEQLDRVSAAIAGNVKESILDKDDLVPGDMVFFSTFNKKYINHVGVYLGERKFIHASIKYGVIVSSLAEGYYSKTWRKGGRNN
jgi:cell wall-associated NlpC family hydrolase